MDILYKLVYEEIKKAQKIVILRHVSPDPDALGAQAGLATLIKNNFSEKEVLLGGSGVSKLKFITSMDTIESYDGVLTIILDTANANRIDGVDFDKSSKIIKIDHHPFYDEYADIEVINEAASSTSEMIYDFYLVNKDKLVLSLEAEEKLYYGILADTGHFMHSNTTSHTFGIMHEIYKNSHDFNDLHRKLYEKTKVELAFLGYVYQHLNYSLNGVGYLYFSEDVLTSHNVEKAYPGNIINQIGYVEDLYVVIFITEDKDNEMYRVNIRSKGPIINKVAEIFGGGGHPLASGCRIKEFSKIKEIVDAIDLETKLYLDR